MAFVGYSSIGRDGYSVGEYTAACLAGVFSLEDGLKLISERGQLMQRLPLGGKMAVAFADEKRVEAAIAPYRDSVSIAALNGPENTVISGAGEIIEILIKELQVVGISTQRLKVSHAFHSPLMDPMLETFEKTAAGLKLSPGRNRADFKHDRGARKTEKIYFECSILATARSFACTVRQVHGNTGPAGL